VPNRCAPPARENRDSMVARSIRVTSSENTVAKVAIRAVGDASISPVVAQHLGEIAERELGAAMDVVDARFRTPTRSGQPQHREREQETDAGERQREQRAPQTRRQPGEHQRLADHGHPHAFAMRSTTRYSTTPTTRMISRR